MVIWRPNNVTFHKMIKQNVVYIVFTDLQSLHEVISVKPYCTQKGQNCIQFWPFQVQ